MENLIEAFWGITISIGVSALIFVGANRLFDLVVDRWLLFRAITELSAAPSFQLF